MADVDDLRELITDLAVVHGKVVLSSGQEADYYIDLRRLTLAGAGAPLVGRVLRELTADWDYDAVGGLTLGADPVAIAVMHAAGVDVGVGVASSGHQTIDAFVVRKSDKKHGLQQRIEGPSISGKRVLIVEDVSTTGSSPLSAVEAARAAGADVVGVALVVDRGGVTAIRGAGLECRAAYTLADLGLS